MGTQRKGRELALQVLYQLDVTGDSSERALAHFWENFEVPEAVRGFAGGLVRGVLERRIEIDALIRDAAENWRLERLSQVDLNVLRIAVQEMTGGEALPVEIAINEAIEIARRFGTQESAAFVNGVLDQIARRMGLKGGVGKEVDDG
jgi:N utilization substance protein B